MAAFNSNILQQTIFIPLNGDATLGALITGVYNHVPADTPLPYIVLGKTTYQDYSTVTTNQFETHFTLHIFSREAGNKEGQEIMERVHTLLHDTNPAMTGYTLVNLRFVSSDIQLEDDGVTYHATMRLRAVVEEA